MKHIVFNEKAIEFFNGEKSKALDDIAVTVIHKDTLEQKDKEIERLNNIINELEKWLNEEYDATIFDYQNAIEDVLDKLRELKGSDK